MRLPESLESQFELIAQVSGGNLFHHFRVKERESPGRESLLRLLPDSLSQDEAVVNAFHDFFLKFSNVVNRSYLPAVYSVAGVVSGPVYVIEEPVVGTTLRQYVQSKSQAPHLHDELIEILGRVSEALHSTHQRRLFHLAIGLDDIIIVDGDPRKVKLVGFGAQILIDGDRFKELSDQYRALVAPEVLSGGKLSPSADVFSLGKAIQPMMSDWGAYDDVLSKATSENPLSRYNRPREFASALRETREKPKEQLPKKKPSPPKNSGGLHPLLSLTTEPLEATVTVDGRNIGTTTSEGLLIVWKNGINIVLEKSGYQSETLDLTATPEDLLIHVKLKPGLVTLVTNPWGASVKINGKFLGVTGRNGLSVPWNQGDLEIEKEGFKKERVNFAEIPIESEIVVELEVNSGSRFLTKPQDLVPARQDVNHLGKEIPEAKFPEDSVRRNEPSIEKIIVVLTALLVLFPIGIHYPATAVVVTAIFAYPMYRLIRNLYNDGKSKKKISDPIIFADRLQSPHESLNQALIESIRSGDVNNVEELLKKGADPNCRSDINDFPALTCASFSGNLDVVKTLLSYGADVNARTKYEATTAEDLARSYGYTEILRVLHAHSNPEG